MRAQIYVVYDIKAENAGGLITAHTDDEAKREFSILANDMQTQVGRHAEDFILYRIGVYDTNLPGITPCTAFPVCKAIDLRKVSPLFGEPVNKNKIEQERIEEIVANKEAKN